MIVKKELKTRNELIGDFIPNENTDVLLNFKQTKEDWEQSTESEAQERTEFNAEGFPRSFLDGIDQDNLTVEEELDSSSGFSTTGTVSYNTDADVLEDSKLVANLYSGFMTSSSSIPSDGGTARAIGLLFKCHANDVVDDSAKAIFTQRISTNIGYHIGITYKRLYVRAYDSSNNVIFDTYVTSENLSANTWYSIILYTTSTTCAVFLNGVRRKYFSITGGNTIDYNNLYQLGAMLGGGYAFYGKVRSLWIAGDTIGHTACYAFQKTYYNNYRAIPNTSSILTSGTWAYNYDFSLFSNGWSRYSGTEGDYFELTYYGNAIDLYMREYSNGGKVYIYIDDEYIEEIDTYNAVDQVSLVGSYTNNFKTTHTIKIYVSDIPVVGDQIHIDYFIIKDTVYYVNTNGFEDLHPDEDVETLSKLESIPRGLNRKELDNIAETNIFFYRYQNSSDDDLHLTNGCKYAQTEILFDNPTIVLDNESGGYAYTNDAPSNDGGTYRTFISWFKPSSADINSSYGAIVTQRSTTSRGYHLGMNNVDMIYVRLYDSTGSAIINYDPGLGAGTVLQADKWYSVVFTHDNANYEIYLNGVLEDSGTYTGTPDYTSNYFKMGRALTTNSLPFYGQISTFYLKSAYWAQSDVDDYLDNVLDKVRLLPTHCNLTVTGNWEWKQLYSVYNKEYESTSLNDTYELTFKGKDISFVGTKDTDGGTFDWYIDDVYQGTVNTYYTTYLHTTLFSYTGTEFGTKVLKIINTSGTPIRLGEITFNAGDNYIIDESGKGNDVTLKNYTNCGRDIVTFSRYEFALEFDKDDYPNHIYMELPSSAYDNIGDNVFCGFTFKPPSVGASDEAIHFLDDSNGANNRLLTMTLGRYISLGYDLIGVNGDFGGGYWSTSGHLDTTHWYFFGTFIDDINERIWVMLTDLTDEEDLMYFYTSYTGTNYARSNFNTPIINYATSTSYGTFKLDNFIFEGDCTRTPAEILDEVWDNFYCSGGNLEAEANVLAISSIDGVIKLRQESLNYYIDGGYYYSKIIDLDTPLLGSGKINLSKEIPTGASISSLQTRTSEDPYLTSPTWSSWEDVSDIGVIASPNRRYMQIRFFMQPTADKSQSPTVSNIQVLDIDSVPYDRKAFCYPITYSLAGDKLYVLGDVTNLHQVIENNGVNFITFEVPYNSPNNNYIYREIPIRLFDEFYIVKKIEDERTDRTIKKVYAEALFYYLGKMPPLREKDFLSTTASAVINYILEGTGWELETCDITITRDFSIDNLANCLEMLRNVQKLWGGDLIFDNSHKTVSLYNDSSEDNGLLFSYKKNLENTKRIIDTTELAGRVYVYGEDDLSIAEVNDGLEYVENNIEQFTFPEFRMISKIINIGYFTDANELLSYANYIKNEYALETVTYEVKAKDISVLETPNGDINYNINEIVTCFDEELNIELKAKIVSIDYNILQPYLSDIVLSTSTKNLGDEITEFKKYQARLKKINWTTFLRMFRQYLYHRIRGVGYVSAEYITVNGTPAVGSTGIVNLSNPKSYLNVRSGAGFTYSIIGSKNHGDSITIQGLYDNGNWYKIYSISI